MARSYLQQKRGSKGNASHPGITTSHTLSCLLLQMNNYIVRSYRDVIVITKFVTRRASKTQSIVMY